MWDILYLKALRHKACCDSHLYILYQYTIRWRIHTEECVYPCAFIVSSAFLIFVQSNFRIICPGVVVGEVMSIQTWAESTATATASERCKSTRLDNFQIWQIYFTVITVHGRKQVLRLLFLRVPSCNPCRNDRCNRLFEPHFWKPTRLAKSYIFIINVTAFEKACQYSAHATSITLRSSLSSPLDLGN